MKIDKTNPLHWLYLLWTSCLSLFFLPLRIIFPKHTSSVVLYGHKLTGNIHALFSKSKSNSNIFFLTLDPSYYSKIKNKQNVLLALNPFHFLKVIRSTLIISDHGLHSLILLQKLTNIQFADVWHGIPFKGFTPETFKIQRKYKETWVSSSLLKQMYIERFGFKPEQVHVTGYGRTDLVLQAQQDKNVLKKQYKISADKKIILFAPTWKQDDKNRDEIPFGLNQEEFLAQLKTFARKNNSFLIFRFHLNSKIKAAQDDQYSIHLPFADYPDSEAIIGLSDVLITDWSSIAFDMMVLDNPLIFLDTKPPFKDGFSLPPSYRCGDCVTSMDELLQSLESACNEKESYMAQHQPHYAQVKKDVYDDTLDGKSTQRYFERIKVLLGK